jgi:hypothetical protein
VTRSPSAFRPLNVVLAFEAPRRLVMDCAVASGTARRISASTASSTIGRTGRLPQTTAVAALSGIAKALTAQ